MPFKLSMPTSFGLLIILLFFFAALTHVLPAGQYQKEFSDALGREVPVAGSYQYTEASPQGLADIVLAPIAGFYDPSTYAAAAIDVGLFVLMIGGFLGVVTKTGAIDTGIARVTAKLQGKEIWMIPILMIVFALCGTTFGMAEETIPFYGLLIPVFLAAGFDALTAVAVIMIGAGIGTMGSTINPFATVLASNAAGISFKDGMELRLFIFGIGLFVCIFWVMRYAIKVKKDPQSSLVASFRESNLAHFLGDNQNQNQETPELTKTQSLVLALFASTFGIMVWGITAGGWWMAEMSALFIVMGIIIGFVARLGEQQIVNSFVAGASDLVGVALVIGLARGIVVILNDGAIIDTLLNYAESVAVGTSSVVFINVIYIIEALLSFVISSSSALAVLSMPILAPLGDFAGVDRSLVVTAFVTGMGVVHMVTPTLAFLMGGLAIGRVPFSTWVRFAGPLLLVLSAINMTILSIAVLM
ncbi:YfcC family protein [Parendozoicomonas haliclonae]|uniref:C4-dicarboxylate anaerobic carrier n=1 Tax=Parendozoicomonas haliclonae TaxID=1960125 RepID=A0A1X7ARV3_9GAMM|nr:YfcC family protein [Parendozoicomonas haliclonae]SMA50819.1 hypothetical protein EHSB41UT_04636 [Parendozoicomonas haliclonae]